MQKLRIFGKILQLTEFLFNNGPTFKLCKTLDFGKEIPLTD